VRRVARLGPVVELVDERAFELTDDPDQVDALPGLRVRREELRELAEELDVLGERAAQVRPLDLHHDLASDAQACRVSLAETGDA
jgi:hypothetical protein